MAAASTASPRAAPEIDPRRRAELDDVVERARAAAEAFRRLDQAAVDRIVWPMVVAGPRAAVELAQVAIEETGFGVFEDKVVKNYVATEFLYDYLKDKKTVGVIDEDPERNLEYVAEPIGVVMAITPVTNPTSTVLFKAIVAREDAQRHPLPALAARDALRGAHASRSCARPARRRGCRRTRSRWSPTRRARSPTTSSTTPASTSSGRPAARRWWRLANAAGKPRHQRRAGQRAGVPAPQRRRPDGRRRHPDLEDVRRLGDLPGRADVRRSTTRSTTRRSPSSSAWAPACSRPTRSSGSREIAFGRRPASRDLEAVGQSPARARPSWRASARRGRHEGAARAAARATSTALAAHPLVHEKLMPVLGLVRSPERRARASTPASWSPSAAAWATPRRSTRATRR